MFGFEGKQQSSNMLKAQDGQIHQILCGTFSIRPYSKFERYQGQKHRGYLSLSKGHEDESTTTYRCD